jgi:hypothetical protein
LRRGRNVDEDQVGGGKESDAPWYGAGGNAKANERHEDDDERGEEGVDHAWPDLSSGFNLESCRRVIPVAVGSHGVFISCKVGADKFVQQLVLDLCGLVFDLHSSVEHRFFGMVDAGHFEFANLHIEGIEEHVKGTESARLKLDPPSETVGDLVERHRGFFPARASL